MTNFNRPCYALPLYNGNGLNLSGDSNAAYDAMYYVVTPGYELVLVGTYPNSRFLSATVYDSHLAVTSSMIDQNILPLNSTMANPYQIGAPYIPSQQYGITIGFGSAMTPTPSPGCSTADTTIDQNFLDASQIHPLLDWGVTDPAVLSPPFSFPAHVTGLNTAGIIMVRKYVTISTPALESIIVRQTSTGCAIPAALAVSSHILYSPQGLSWPLLSQSQIQYHQQFSNGIEDLQCYNPDPNNAKQWFAAVDYVPLANLGSALDLNLPPANLAPILAGQQFIRLRFPAPTTPNIPCNGGCSLTGSEDLRYYSLSFMGASNGYGKVTLTSLSDSAFTQDPNGNVTLLISMSSNLPIPAFATAANYYNVLDMTKINNYTALSRIELRNLLPAATFSCSTDNVLPFYMEYNNVGGSMGQYVPTIDFPTLAALSIPAAPPPMRANTCTLVPAAPVACGPSQPNLFPPN